MQVIVSTSTSPATFPAGTLLGQYRFRLVKNGVPWTTQYVDAPLPPQVIFANVSAGTYTLEIVRLTTNMIPVGATYSAPVTVAEPPPVTADAVIDATVTVV